MGRNAPNPIAIPPILGMGTLWTFLSSGMSRIFALRARLIEIGISKMVIMVDMRKVEKMIIITQVKRFRVQRSGFKKSRQLVPNRSYLHLVINPIDSLGYDGYAGF
jgi:hypothetical protein